ncbi:PREDICTED: tyrosine-protein phosphatase Lar-like isoform X1 [Branchiostoma belcheri]|uniref:Receptor-type tyrosine-protein phosphatase alpha n=1 Tax=Branchiostoma belcheri TaxID=7741 RepID=A0A6P4ZJK9_BRABE|nr:PREDICTED: tyrosine-protein phosphatase Lar-like isoform X1 [Branchiostoma belcheri]
MMAPWPGATILIVLCFFLTGEQVLAQDCSDLYDSGQRDDGVFPVGNPAFSALCDMTYDGGGWTVIQKRETGTPSFDKQWSQYTDGFGSIHTEDFWLGLDRIHQLTSQKAYKLAVKLEDWNGTVAEVQYSQFSVGGYDSSYTLQIGGYTGTTPGDSLTISNGAKFSTMDQDNDGNVTYNCAQYNGRGGWWYPMSCGQGTLNGYYLTDCKGQSSTPACMKQGLVWATWRGPSYSLKKSTMMIKPVLLAEACGDGFYGDDCRPCGLCANGAFCDKSSGYCPYNSPRCGPGYTGILCQTECGDGFYGEDCRQHCGHCSNGGACSQTFGFCPSTTGPHCAPGYQGGQCQTACSEGKFGADCTQTCHCKFPDECSIEDGRCLYGGCEEGWTGQSCQDDVDECVSQPCKNGATCVNMPPAGSATYSCDCAPGWTGTNCDEEVDECQSNPCTGGTCVDRFNGYMCTCSSGNIGVNCDIDPAVLVPGDLQAVSASSYCGDGQIHLSWTPPTDHRADVTGYDISYHPAGTAGSPQVISNATAGTRYFLQNLQSYTRYEFSVRALVTNGVGAWPRWKTAQTNPGNPTPVRSLQLRNISSTVLLATWEEPEALNGQLLYYQVELFRGFIKVADNTVNPGDALRVNYEGLVPATEYTVRVVPFNLGPCRGTESRTNMTTSDGLPSAPRGVYLSRSQTACVVQWDVPKTPNGTIIKYTIYLTAMWIDAPPGAQAVEYSQDNFNPYTRMGTFPLRFLKPNSRYRFNMTASTYAGPGEFSSYTDSTSMCEVPPGKPITPTPPSMPQTADVIKHDGYPITLSQVSERTGPVECYHVLVVEMTDEMSLRTLPNVDQLNVVSQQEAASSGNNVTAYVAMAFNRDDFVEDVFLGDGRKTSCAGTGRRRREQSVQDIYEEVYTNSPLKPGTRYTVVHRAYGSKPQDGSQPLYSSSGYSLPIMTAPSPGTNWMLILIILCSAVIVLIILTVLILLIRRRLNNKAAANNGMPHMRRSKKRSGLRNSFRKSGGRDDEMPLHRGAAYYPPIPMERLEKEFNRRHANDDQLFREEYDALPQEPSASYEAFLMPENSKKNRFVNIYMYDHSRVHLTPIPGVACSDYINANYVDGYKHPKKFIAAQGPKEETLQDFWRMVWEQNTATIVMVTNVKEKNKVKCSQYWPDAGSKQYGDITVTSEETSTLVDYIIRTLTLERGEESRTLLHFHFTTWPDFGVPKSPLGMMKFVRRVKAANPANSGPIVVHCSAGVGRTGTFIVIDAMFEMIAAEQRVDVFGFVGQIRQSRCMMVQTEGQYVFIYQALLEHFLYGDTEIEVTNLRRHLQQLAAKLPDSQDTGMEAEFKKLTQIPIEKHNMRSGNLPDNIKKNRVLQILPYDTSRVYITPTVGMKNSDYINAAFVDGYREKDAYIATQGPLPHTVNDFWKMVWEWKSCSIIMLTELQERGHEKCHKYWPGEVEMYGDICVEAKGDKTFQDYTVRTFHITNTKTHKFQKHPEETEGLLEMTASCRTVQQFHFHGWPEIGIPANAAGMLDLIGQVERQQQQSGNGPITVHCSSGAGRTGAFITLSTVIERVKAEGICDVFQTVKSMRYQRPHMVQTVEQYQFIYQAVLEYLDSFTLYANFKDLQ